MKIKLILFLTLIISANTLNAQIKLDNGNYRIAEFQPLYSLENEVKIKKTTRHKFEAKLRQEKGKIYIKITPKYDNTTLVSEGIDSSTVYVIDKQLFFDMESSDRFSFASARFATSIVTLPFKVRFREDMKNDSLSNVALGLNNINLFLGMKSTTYTYESNKLYKKSITIGGFLGPTSIKLNKNNSSLGIDEEINRLGINFGFGMMGQINRFNLGVGFGIDMIINQDLYNWEWNKGGFLGFILGVSL